MLASTMLVVPQALADEWTGATGTDWGTASNWDTNGVPTIVTDVQIGTAINPSPGNMPLVTAPVNQVNSVTIGASSGSSATLTIDAGWLDAVQFVTVGNAGHGTLVIRNGGDVTAGSDIRLGDNSTLSNGTVTVDGTDSTLKAQGFLIVGTVGAGTLTVSGGADVTSTAARIGSFAAGHGVVTVVGTGSTWTNNSVFIVGDSGQGVLSIDAGGKVTSSSAATLGKDSGSSGTVDVTQTNSLFLVDSDLSVGVQGTGTIGVSDGGGVLVSGNLSIGQLGGGDGTVTVSGIDASSNPATLQVGNGLKIGVSGTGTLIVSDGGTVTNNGAGIIGSAVSGSGTVTVTGANSTWNNGLLIVGDSGRAVLTIDDNGRVNSSSYIIIGNQADSLPTVTVKNGGQLAATSDLTVSKGDLLIQSGGKVTSASGHLGMATTVGNSVSVDGAGSTWDITDIGGEFVVGYQNDGTLAVSNGGTVTVSNNAVIGYLTSKTGFVSVTGADSTLDIAQSLYIGGDSVEFGQGDLVIADGGVVTVDKGRVNIGIAGVGGPLSRLHIGGYAGTAAVAPGTLNTDEVYLGPRPGGLVFNHTSNSYTFAPKISGSGIVENDAGTTILTADSSGFAGTTSVSGGTLIVNGALGGAVEVLSGGRLGGSGTLTGNVLAGNTGIGTIAPGNSPGTLTIGGNLTLGSNAILDFQLGDPSGTAGVDSDLINVAGNLTLDGTLNVADAGGFGPGLYRLVNYGGSLTDNGLLVGAKPAGYSAIDLTVQTAMAGQVNLLVSAPTALSFWNGSHLTPNGKVNGGSGDWTPNNTNWTDATGTVSGAYDPTALLIFAGAPGTVTVDKGPSTSSMQFAVDGYVIDGEDLTLDGAATVRVGDGTGAGAGYTATIAANLIGAGSLDKTDLGTLVLTGKNSYSGGTTVTGGTLVANGTLGGPLAVLGAGRLQGSGTVGDLTAAGTVAPGNSIGTLNVAGNILFSPNSIYEVEADASGKADRIVATGTAALKGGTVKVLANTGDYAAATTYTILTAGGGVTGSFTGGVTSNLAFLDPTLSYDPTSVYLTLTRNATGFGQVGITPNQIAAAGGVESLGSGNAVYDAVLGLSEDQARAAFDQLSGEIHASAQTVLIEDSRFVRDAAMERLRAAFDGVGAAPGPVMAYGDGGPEAAPADTDRFAVWGRAFGSWGSFDGDGNAADLDRDLGGFFVGGDALIADAFRLGILGGYSRSSFDIDDRRSSGTSDNYHLGIYGGMEWGGLALRTGAAYTWHDLSTGRSIAFPGFADTLSADYSARTAQVFGETGYRFEAGQSPIGVLAFEPFANLAYVNVATDGFTETGGAAALAGREETTQTTFTTLGLRASSAFTLGEVAAVARGTVGWRHAFGDVTPSATLAFIGGDPFTVAGVRVARDAAVVEAGFDFNLSPAAVLGIAYGGQFSSGAVDQSVNANLNVKF
ncbi:autotransporter domain-containing protein [Mesorhizobium sp. BAC0120]|uniref:autotransporter domain-containing protein n=1 Tax=Mesorhizobium sp. BAC0120 TaxID=3090670 RepID=UPI00298D113C|nr:autotransporter domain-containing protein [Mesorhizobium sp. BAC0120]MDW6020390.1 autotransporter domain-containing protein [Mesorhizobium sp. BAC0120]